MPQTLPGAKMQDAPGAAGDTKATNLALRSSALLSL